MTKGLSCRIIILNYNGRGLLEQCLPSIVDAAQRSSRGAQVTVLDNCSRDESRSYVQTHFSTVKWVDAPSNLVLCSYNAYVASITEEVVLLLNNDIKVDPDFVNPLMVALENDPNVFFAAPQGLNFYTHQHESGMSRMEFRYGLPWGETILKNPGLPGLTMQTGFGAFRRDRFLELGGYDPIYLPGTVEDMDLCFRAYRRGWTGRYCPTSVVYHIGQASFKKEFGASKIRIMNRRNLHLFTWKNIHDPLLVAQYMLWLPFRMLVDLVRGRWEYFWAFGEAVARWMRAGISVRAGHDYEILSERAVFVISKRL